MGGMKRSHGALRGRRGATAKDLASKALLSVDEAAILLGTSHSSLYRAIKNGDLPLPLYRMSGRWRIPRRAVERLLDGEPPAVAPPPSRMGSAADSHTVHKSLPGCRDHPLTRSSLRDPADSGLTKYSVYQRTDPREASVGCLG